MKIKLTKYLTILGAFIALSTTTQATTVWTGAIDEDWANAGNWSNGLPTATNSATMLSGTARITSSTPTSLVSNISIALMTGGTSSVLYIDSFTVTTNANFSISDTGYLEMTNSFWTSTSQTFTLGNSSSALFRNSQLQLNGITAAAAGNVVLDATTINTTRISQGYYAQMDYKNSSHIYFDPVDSLYTGNIHGTMTFYEGTLNSTDFLNFTYMSTIEFVLSSAETKISAKTIDLQGGKLSLIEGSETFVGGEVFDIFEVTTITGSFASITTSTLAEGLSWDLSRLYSDGIVSIAGSTVIPEPSTYAAIFGTLALGLAIYRRRK